MVIDIFNKYIGLSYKERGRDFDGVDCYGIVYLIFKEEKGIELPDFLELNYQKNWSELGKNHILESITDDWIKVGENDYRRFDVHIFQDAYGVAAHTGLNIGHGKFIHVLDQRPSDVGKLELWKRILHGTMRYKNA
jgi:probable lipoprotein NlpC